MSTTVLQPRAQSTKPSGSTMAAIVAGVALVFAVGYGLNQANVSSVEEAASGSANAVVHDVWSRTGEQIRQNAIESAAVADFRAFTGEGTTFAEQARQSQQAAQSKAESLGPVLVDQTGRSYGPKGMSYADLLAFEIGPVTLIRTDPRQFPQ